MKAIVSGSHMRTIACFLCAALTLVAAPAAGDMRGTPLRRADETGPLVSRVATETIEARRGPGLGTTVPSRALTGYDEPRQAPPDELSFPGMSGLNQVTPSDANGDAGPTQYVQGVNSREGALLAVFDKAGNRTAGPVPLESMWADAGGVCATGGEGDPVVQYDTLERRWLFSQFAFRVRAGHHPEPPFYACVAITDSEDALDDVTVYTFRLEKRFFADMPKLSVWPDGYYMASHVYGPREYKGEAVMVLEKQSLLDGVDARVIRFRMRDDFGIVPSDLVGTTPPPPGTPNYFVSIKDDDLGQPRDALKVWAFDVDWDRPDDTRVYEVATLPTEPFSSNMCRGSFLCLPQKGAPMDLDPLAGDPFIKGAYSGYMTTYRVVNGTASLLLNHTIKVGKRKAGVRWYELRDLDGTPQIYQQGTQTDEELSRWIGALSVDKAGNMALGYSTTSSTEYPSVRSTGRMASDPLGSMTIPERLVVAGTGAQTQSPRWGDYNSMSVDPVDDCTFWYTNQYNRSTGPRRWHTVITAFSLPGCS